MLERLQRFCGRLRQAGLKVGPSDVADACRALLIIDLGQRWQVYLALQTVLCRQLEDREVFTRVFAEFFEDRQPFEMPRDPGGSGEGEGGGSPETTPDLEGANVEELPEPDSMLPSYSPVALLQKDGGAVSADEMPAVERLAEELARKLAQRIARRLKRRRRGQVDPVRTLRRALRQGGEVLQLRRRKARRQKARLVSLLDVSGSMQPYGRFLLYFLIALADHLPRTETFVFSTELTLVTRDVRDGNLEKVAGTAPDWAGGTRIGVSFERFLREFAPSMVDGRTAVLVMSDGLDTGEVDLLGKCMARLQRRAGKIIWLNPLAGDPKYAPLARGMRAALPYVDVLAPAHSLESLLNLGRYITGGTA